MIQGEPCSSANQITAEFYFAQKSLGSGSVVRMLRRNGTHTYYTYHLIRFWS